MSNSVAREYETGPASDENEIFCIICDPADAQGRIPLMYDQATPFEDMDVAPKRRAGVRLAQSSDDPVSAEVEVVSDRDVENTKWADCIAAIKDRQCSASFAELFRHFAPRVKAFLIRSGADDALAEECAQEVMATLWRKAHQFDPSRASAATWIFTIARNRRIDSLRKQRRPEPEELTWGPQHEPDQSETLELQQETDKLVEAIAALPEKQKDLIEKAYFGDLSHREIAEQTGLPLGTIKSRIRLALERLRHEMS